MKQLLRNIRGNIAGSSAAEYALIIALAGITGTAAATFGNEIGLSFSGLAAKIISDGPTCRDLQSGMRERSKS